MARPFGCFQRIPAAKRGHALCYPNGMALRRFIPLGFLAFSLACGGIVTDKSATGSGTGSESEGTASGEGNTSSSSGAVSSPTNGAGTAEQPVFRADDDRFVIRYVVLGAKPGSCTQESVKSFTYLRARRQLTSARCSGSNVEAERDAWPAVTRTLEPGEAQQIEAILPTMRRQPAMSQGWDGWDIFLEVGDAKYSDRDINYMGNPHATHIRELYELVNSLPL